MAFDAEAAKAAGYTDAEIADHLASARGYDVAGARRSGYSDTDIVQHLSGSSPLSRSIPLPPPEPPGPPPSALSAAARGVVRGVTLGANDEIKGAIAGVGGLFTGEGFGAAYERGRDAERAADRAADAAHPYLGAAGQLYGGVGGAVAGGAAAGATGLTALGTRALAPVNALLRSVPGGQAVGAAARVVGSGAAGGGAAGFLEGQGGMSARLENAGQGAALGGVAGGVLGAGVRLGGAVAGRVGHVLGLRDANVAAERQILRAMGRSGVDVDDAAARLAAAGNDPVALVDVGGRNTVNLGRVAANTPGEAMETADQMVQMRRLGRPDRLMAAGDQAFGGGSGTDIATRIEATRVARSAAADPLYDRVRAFGPVDDPEVTESLMRLPDRVFGQATEFARLDGRAPERLIVNGENGRQLSRVPTMEDLDHVAQALGDEIDAARRAGNNGLARALTQRREALVGRLDDVVVDPNTGERIYAQARAAWAGPSAQLEATEAGRTALRTDRDVVAQQMQAPQEVQDAYRLGAGRDFADRVSDPGRASGAARLMLEDGQMQARLNALLAPQARNALNDRLRREVEMTAVERAVSPRAGSQTAAIQAAGEDMGRDPMGPIATALWQATSGQPMQALRTIGADAWRRGAQGINPATSDALANRLFATDPAARAAVVGQIRNRLLMDRAQAELYRSRMRPALQGVGVVSGLAVD